MVILFTNAVCYKIQIHSQFDTFRWYFVVLNYFLIFISVDDSSCQSVDDVNELSFNDTLEQMAASAATLKSEPESDSKKTDKVCKSTSQTKSLDVNNCDWEELFDESGEYVDHSLIDEVFHICHLIDCCVVILPIFFDSFFILVNDSYW